MKSSSTVFPQVFPNQVSYFEMKDKHLARLMSKELPHLSRGIKELIAATVSKTNGCLYCLNHHFNSMQDYGIDYDIASQVMVDYKTSALEERIKALLHFCEILAVKQNKPDIEIDFKVLEISYSWTKDELIEAIIITHEVSALNRIANNLNLEDESLDDLYTKRTPIQRK